MVTVAIVAVFDPLAVLLLLAATGPKVYRRAEVKVRRRRVVKPKPKPPAPAQALRIVSAS